MSTREKILAYAKENLEIRSQELVKKLKISRQNVAAQLRKLVSEGKLVRYGATRGAIYKLPGDEKAQKPVPSLALNKKLLRLEEDVVLREVELRFQLKKRANRNAQVVFAYAFTEMLNNAIDHSKSASASISVSENKGQLCFEIRDFGIGIFHNVAKQFKLRDEFEGLEHVLKGKQTTAPEAHSGEGIFFTSRIADRFVLRSHKLQATIDNQLNDTFVSEERNWKGTSVSFSISANTKKRLETLFEKYTNPNFVFDHTDPKISVAAFGGSLSRSQAKRLLHGLDQYNRLTFNFQGVKEIGQGFADEIFRVYQNAHPEKLIDYENANNAIAFLIQRAKKS